MLRQRSPLARILFVVLAVFAGLAALQLTRHRLQAGTAATRPTAMACSPVRTVIAPSPAASAPSPSSSVALRMDYAGAEALIGALERDSLSEADVDSLLRIRGVCAMVDNVPRYFAGNGVAEFRKEIRAFARTKKGGDADAYFQLSDAWRARTSIRALVTALPANDRTMSDAASSLLEPYRPDSGSLTVTTFFVAGGVSDGFVFESDPTSLYANLARGGSDVNGVVLNMAHEVYHVMQLRAQDHAGIPLVAGTTDAAPPLARLYATTLAEGTANYAADPTRWPETGPAVDSARQRYRRNADPKRVAENFARFDAVLTALSRGRMTWDKAYAEGFTNRNDASFYFVGYKMAKAIERYCGRECIGRLFREPPVEFFRRYAAISHQHPELAGRFSAETEAVIATEAARPAR